MHKIKIFCLVEGKIIDKLPDRVSGTYIRIHNILNELRKFSDIKLISIPYKYNLEGDIYKDSWIQRRKNFIYSWIVPYISILTILLIRPHYLYFSYPHAVGKNTKWTNKLNYLIIKICKKLKIKIIMYSHDWIEQNEIQGQGKNPILSEELERNLVEISDILLVAFSKYPSQETIVLPGGLNELEFSHLKYKIVKNRFNIGYTGSLHPGKGIDILVNAVVNLHRKYQYIHLYLWGSLQKELDDYIFDVFRIISKYFEQALAQFKKENPEIETNFKKINENNFSCDIYVSGEHKLQCRIWLGDELGTKQIFYSEGVSFNQNSYNESFSANHDGFKIFLESLMGFDLSEKSIKTPDKVAEYLWIKFTQPLTY